MSFFERGEGVIVNTEMSIVGFVFLAIPLLCAALREILSHPSRSAPRPPMPMALLPASASTSLNLPRPSSLLLTLLRPLYPTLEIAHRLALNTLAISLLAFTLPFSLYLTYGQTERIARGEGVWGGRVKEMSGLIWEGFDWLEECEDEGVLRGWIERLL